MSLFSQDLLILTSPPASGKTYWIHSFRKSCQQSILVISPLRALADECKRNWNDSVIVMTPEEWCKKKVVADIVIMDEFHLFFHWGDSFRPLMWEVFFEISLTSQLCILLTATLPKMMVEEIQLYSANFDRVIWVDCGNHQLKNHPSHYFKCPSREWILKEVVSQSTQGTKLIFCRYRNEVHDVARELKKKGHSVLTCIGGESRFFSEKLSACSHPEFIVSTTVLSHGVNLPEIQNIYFLYEVKDKDFWIQMVARGGRRGESYRVFGLERPLLGSFHPLRNFLFISWFSVRHFFRWPFPTNAV